MKKIVINLVVCFALFTADLHSYGQELKPKKCENGKWGYIDKNTNVMVVSCKYDKAMYFFEGLARVRLNGKWGYIDKTGKEVIPLKYDRSSYYSNGVAHVKLNGRWGYVDFSGNFYEGFTAEEARERTEQEQARQAHEIAEREARKKAEIEATFSYFAQNYIKQEINSWLQKGEFEKTGDWQMRVNETNRKTKETELIKEAEQAYIAERSKDFQVGSIAIGSYDADKEVFLITNSVHGNWFVSVPVNDAPVFKDNWNNLVKIPQYVIRDDRIAFAGYRFETVEVAVASKDVTEQKENQTMSNTSSKPVKSPPQNFSSCMKKKPDELLAEMQINNYTLYKQYSAGLNMAKTGRRMMNIGTVTAIGGLGLMYWGMEDHNGNMGVLGIGLVLAGATVESIGIPLRTVGNKRKNIALRIYCTQQSLAMQSTPYFKFNVSPNRVGFAYVF